MAPPKITEPEVSSLLFLLTLLILHVGLIAYSYFTSFYFPEILIVLAVTFIIGLLITRRLGAGGKFKHTFRHGKLIVNSQEIDVKDKTVIITGGNTGIGYATAEYFGRWGAKVIIASRDEEKGKKAVEKLRKETKNEQIHFRKLDLASFESIKTFAANFAHEKDKIDILINNAGVMMCPFTLTKEGFELQFGTNHLGHFLLTTSLLPLINEETGRIINLSSYGHNFAPDMKNFDYTALDERAKATYNSTRAYGISKYCNIIFTLKLQQELKHTHIKAFSVHPGGVNTELTRHFSSILLFLLNPLMQLLLKTPKEGAQTTLYCALHPDAIPGEYYSDCHLGHRSKQTFDQQIWDQLWDASVSLTSSPVINKRR